MRRVVIVTLTVGARAKEGKGGGGGEKKILFSLPAPSPLPLTRPISSSLREVSTWRFREQIARSKKTPALQAKSRENFHVLLPVALLEYLPPSHQRGHILVRLLSANKLVAYVIAHVASVSVKFRGKKRTRKWIFGFDRGRNETRAKK